jgi:hypothetical protein
MIMKQKVICKAFNHLVLLISCTSHGQFVSDDTFETGRNLGKAHVGFMSGFTHYIISFNGASAALNDNRKNIR